MGIIRTSRNRSLWYVPDPGDLYQIYGEKLKINRFIKTEGVYKPVPHILYLWVRRIRPAPIETAAKFPGERQRILGVIKIWKPPIFPEGAKIEPQKWMSPAAFKRQLKKGFTKLPSHRRESLRKRNMLQLYRKIGVICEKPKKLGI